MTIETSRIILRPWEEGDAEALFRYASDPQVGPIAGWPAHTSVEMSREVIATVLSEPETYAVVLKETGEPVGSVGIKFASQHFMTDTEAELGAWIGVPYWGQGLIPEALMALLNRCFTQFHCTGVWAGYYDGNEKSRRLQEKCGFLPHHSEETHNTLLDKTHLEHFTFQTREQWERNIFLSPFC